MSAFDWDANFRLAQELRKREDEAALRCALGRAYYAVFGTARNRWVSENGPIPLDVNVHQFVWNAYSRADRTRRFIGQDGFRLLRYRNIADYEDDFPDLLASVERALTIAEKTLNNLSRL